MLPNLFTLANAGCGLLAIAKAIDATSVPEEHFDRLLESSCWLIFLAMLFDALDGRVARWTGSFSDFGAQLDSFADALTFGVAPAVVAKVLLEHEVGLHPRLHFLAMASFSLMAILRLARFNLETEHEEESHLHFSGLPSPAAAGTVIATVLMYLSLKGGIEVDGGTPTAVGKGLELLSQPVRIGLYTSMLPLLVLMLPVLGFLMVSHVKYSHVASQLVAKGRFMGLVGLVFLFMLLYLAPVPALFAAGTGYVLYGIVHEGMRRMRERRA
jgi:CDP-diacylglycerol---serine O-phosphatidyltransferase